MADKAIFMSELKAYCMAKGYKIGWASNKYRDKFGVWPNDPEVRDVAPSPTISAATASWIRRSQLQWAKSKYNTTNASAVEKQEVGH
jgi:hypothetical protein